MRFQIKSLILIGFTLCLISCTLSSEFATMSPTGGTSGGSLVSADSSGITISGGSKASEIQSVTMENTAYTFTATQVGNDVKLVPNQNISLVVGTLYRILVSTASAQSTFTIQTEFPTGAIMAFNTATCPTGWSAFNAGKGRVLVGAGSGNTDADGSALTARALGALGGREFTTGIPAFADNGDTGTPGPSLNLGKVPNGLSNLNAFSTSAADTTLSGDKHDSNMMPYAVVLYCQKN